MKNLISRCKPVYGYKILYDMLKLAIIRVREYYVGGIFYIIDTRKEIFYVEK